MVKNMPANEGGARDVGSIPGSGRSPRGGYGIPLQHSCLENPMDRGAWWATRPQGHKESDTTEATEHARMWFLTHSLVNLTSNSLLINGFRTIVLVI